MAVFLLYSLDSFCLQEGGEWGCSAILLILPISFALTVSTIARVEPAPDYAGCAMIEGRHSPHTVRALQKSIGAAL